MQRLQSGPSSRDRLQPYNLPASATLARARVAAETKEVARLVGEVGGADQSDVTLRFFEEWWDGPLMRPQG